MEKNTNILNNGGSEAVIKNNEGTKDTAKKGKKNKDNYEDDIEQDMEQLSLEAGITPDIKENLPTQATEEKKPAETEKPVKKGKKNRKRGNDDDDDDLDDMLAELEAEYKGTTKPNDKDTNNTVTNGEINTISEQQTKGKENKTEAADQNKKDNKQANTKGKNEVVNKKDNKQTNIKGKNEVANKKDKQATAKGKNEDANKKDKGKKGDKKDEQPQKSKKGPSKKLLESMKEMLAKQKEEDERRKQAMLELERQEKERIRQLEEARKLEEERKEKLRQKQKERLKKLKDEGKFMTAKQKLEKQRAKATLEILMASGLPLPGTGSYAGPTFKRNRRKKQEEQSKESSPKSEEEKTPEPEPIEEEKQEDVVEEEESDIRDAWDQLTDSEDDNTESKEENECSSRETSSPVEPPIKQKEEQKAENILRVHDREGDHETKQDRVIKRIEERKKQNEKNRNPGILRSPVVCVLGHVDHGKTKILDKLKGTNVQEGEAGSITQEIRATIVSPEIITAKTRMIDDFDINSIKFPGLLIIDTPGHESFSNLRNRGSSLCDFAILVIDINQGVQSTTIESINLLKAKKTPFLVALNKIDILYEWKSDPSMDVRHVIKDQFTHTKSDFDRRVKQVIQELNMQGLNAALFWENPNPKTYVSLVPTSAISGDGMGNLIGQLCSLCQKRLTARLQFSEELQCTVLEVSAIQGHGTTVYVILVNGRLKEGDTIIVAGTDGPIVTQIRSLHLPKARSRFQFDEHKEVKGTQGIMVAAKDLEKAIAGWSLSVAYDESEIDYIKDQVDNEFKAAMRSMKVKDKGVYVQASSIGALEALLVLFKTNKIPFSGIKVGPVVKKDVMKASAMLEHDPMYAIILAFNVKVEKDAQELADKEGVKIFSEPIIYHLADRFEEYIKNFKKKKQDEFRNVAVFPCRLKIIPDAIFNKRDPIVLGITVDAGLLRTGTPLCVPAKEGVEIGIVTSLEFDHKPVEIAKKGVDVCIKIEPLPGHTPKLFGRHFDEEDELVSKISREAIDACKEYYRDDLTKSDWKLMAELKRKFQIL